LFPELALFDCHACHHSMNDLRWQPDTDGQLPSGSVRLNDANFVMLFAIAGVISESLEATLREQVTELHQSVAARRPLAKVVAGITNSIHQIEASRSIQENPESARQLLSALVVAGGQSRFRDYVAAEQVVMAIDLLLSKAGLRDAQSDWLNRLYAQVSNEDAFMPAELTMTMLEFEP
jgi:gamma-glutamylcysteine synthetase